MPGTAKQLPYLQGIGWPELAWFEGFFGRSMASAPETRDASDERWFNTGGLRSEIDVQVTVERARQVPVIRSCLKLLSDSVAGLEFGVFQRLGADRVERHEGHPVARLLSDPNSRQTAFEFLYSLVDDLGAHGDFYAERVYGPGGRLLQLKRIDPASVVVEETFDETKRIRFTNKFGNQRVLLEDEIWHIPLPPLTSNIKGSSPILQDGREAVAVAIALQRYANILFTNDATPPYALSMEGNYADEAAKKNMLSAIRKWMTGKNRHVPALLEYNMKPHRMGLTAEEAQFLETRKELWLDLARLWRVPPHKVGLLDKATFSNIEHQSLEFVTDTLRPFLELIERSVNKFLIEDPDLYFEFNVESLLRGDIKNRYEAYAKGRQWGWLSVNDILKMERRNGIGRAGDRYIEPLNMVPVGTDGSSRDQESRATIDRSVAFLRESVARNSGRPRLELVKDAA